MTESLRKTQSASQPDDHPVIQDFLQWTKSQSTRRIGRGGPDNDIEREYISCKILERRLDKREVEKLLDALFQDPEYPLPDADFITRHYLRSFAILLCIGEGRMIHHFSQLQGLQDQYLPFRDEPPRFPKSTRRDIYSAFRREQWAFCAVLLEYNIGYRLDTDEILPITETHRIEEGGSAITFKIAVDGDYDQLVPATDEDLEVEDEHRNTYVIKTYRTPEAKVYYETELNAFKKLKYNGLPPLNIIGFYGSFIREGTYNIILEYADYGTLDDYMQQTQPPSSASDRMTFWERFFDIGHGLVTIHGEEENGSNAPQILLGWHQDVNPSNILVKSRKGKSRYDCHFKLADLGLSHFKKHVPSARDATDNDTWGTNAYGAPETRRSDINLEKLRLKIRQDVDIWSMGCVYSEVATWVDQGWNKVVEYRRRRSEEMKIKKGMKEDCFHDGLAILDAVRQIHFDIVQNRRMNDFVTPEVVNRLVGEMLLVRASRPDARYLYDKSKRIIDEAQAQLDQIPTLPPTQTDARRPPIEAIMTSSHQHARHLSDESSRGLPTTPGSRPWSPESYPYDYSPDQARNGGVSGSPSRLPLSQARYEQHQQQSLSDHAFDMAKGNTTGFQQNHYQPPERTASYPYRPQYQTQGQPFGTPDPSEVPHQSLHHKPSAGTKDEENGNVENKTTFWTEKQRQSPHASSLSASSTGEEASVQKQHGRTSSGSKPPRTIGGTISEKALEDRGSPILRQSRRRKTKNWMPHPEMTVDQGLEVKKEREHGKRIPFPPEDQDLFESLHQRDHAFLIDNSESMGRHRAQARKVLELLSYMLGPTDPDGLDLYFATYPKKLKPGGCYAMLEEFDKRPATGSADMRQRFANILEDYQGKFGKTNIFGKLRHPNSTPLKGPRRFTLYVLTDGVWRPHTTLVEEVKTLVKHMTTHNIPNKHIGIQFIRFGDSRKGKKRLNRLDSKSKLGVELDVIDTTPADGNVWKMLLGPLNPWFDDDTDEDDEDDEDDNDNDIDNGLGISTPASTRGRSRP